MYKRGSIGLFFRGDPNLKRYFPLDGNATDYGESGDDGTPSTSDLIVYPSKFHLGYRFNRDFSTIYKASPKIEIGDVNVEYSAITVMAWVRLKSLPSEGTIGDYRDGFTIVNKFWDGVDRSFELGCNANAPEDTFHFNLSTDTTNANNLASSTTTATKNKWYLVVGTWSSASGYTKIYVNGKWEGQIAVAGNTVRNNSVPLIIGCEKYSNNDTYYQRQFDGDIHEVAIFSRELDKNEISQYYRWAIGIPKRTTIYLPSTAYSTTATLSTLEAIKQSTNALQTLLEATGKSTNALLVKLQREEISTTALQSLLSKPAQRTIALFSDLAKLDWFVWSTVWNSKIDWLKPTKHSANWQKTTKHSGSWTPIPKHSSNWQPITKHD